MNTAELVVLIVIVLAAVGVVALRGDPSPKKRIDWPKRPGCGG